MADQGSNEAVGAPVGAGTAPTAVSIPGLPNLSGSSSAPAGTSTPPTSGNPVIDAIVGQINKIGQQLIADLQYAESIAAYKDPTSGQVADQPGATALAAIIPLVQLVVNGPPAATSGGAAPVEPTPHIISDIEKGRIILTRFNDPNFQAAIAPILVSFQNQFGGIFTIGSAVAKLLGVALPAITLAA